MNAKYEYFDQLRDGRETAEALYNELALDVDLLLDSIDELQVRVEETIDMNTVVYDKWEYVWGDVDAPDRVDLDLSDEEYDQARADWEAMLNAVDSLDSIYSYLRKLKKTLDHIDTERWSTDEN